MIHKPCIYDFEDSYSFIEAWFAYEKIKLPELTLRKWAKMLHLSSDNALFPVFKKKKPMSLALGMALSKQFGLNDVEESYFEVMIKYTEEKNISEKRTLKLILAEMKKNCGLTAYIADPTIYSHWLPMAIFSLSKIKGSFFTKESISSFLVHAATSEQISEAVDLLVKHHLISYDPIEGICPMLDHVTSENDAFISSPHNYFEHVAELAKNGAKVDASEREFQCFTLPIDHDQIPLFKEALRNFRVKVTNLADMKNANQVYQVNLQFFPISKISAMPLKDQREEKFHEATL